MDYGNGLGKKWSTDWTKIHNFRYLIPGQSIFFEKNGNWTKTWTKKYIFHKKFHKMKSMDQKKIKNGIL